MGSQNTREELTKKRMIERIEAEVGFPSSPLLVKLLEDRNTITEIKNYLINVVLPQRNSLHSKDIVKELNKIASKSKSYDKSMGWDIKDLEFNINMQYSRMYNKILAEELDMKYFMYQGGLLTGMNSRDFCREHNGHVYHVEEAKEWVMWTPSKAINITEFNQQDFNSVPPYMNYPGYDPLVDLGGYNCRHFLGFISDRLAKKSRPDIVLDEPQPTNIIVELSKSLRKRDKRIIERKRAELLSQVDHPLAIKTINRLLNTAANEVIAKNEKLTHDGKEITVEEFLNNISPKILKIANLWTQGLKGLIK